MAFTVDKLRLHFWFASSSSFPFQINNLWKKVKRCKTELLTRQWTIFRSEQQINDHFSRIKIVPLPPQKIHVDRNKALYAKMGGFLHLQLFWMQKYRICNEIRENNKCRIWRHNIYPHSWALRFISLINQPSIITSYKSLCSYSLTFKGKPHHILHNPQSYYPIFYIIIQQQPFYKTQVTNRHPFRVRGQKKVPLLTGNALKQIPLYGPVQVHVLWRKKNPFPFFVRLWQQLTPKGPLLKLPTS